MKYVLLARPSSLIVKDMKHLISSAGCKPVPLSSTEEFQNYSEKDVAGIVVSTALSSKVSEKYWEVVSKAAEHYAEKPLFLASYSSVKTTKITANQRLGENGIEHELVSLEEAEEAAFNPKKQILILTQKEISDEERFPKILHCVKKVLSS